MIGFRRCRWRTLVKMGDPFGIGSQHVVRPQVEVAELLTEGTVAAKPAGGRGYCCVEDAEVSPSVKPSGQFEVFEKRPVGKASDFVKRGPPHELPPVSKAEADPGPAGAPCVKSEKRGRIVELEPKRTAHGGGGIEGSSDADEGVGRQSCIGVEKEIDVTGG